MKKKGKIKISSMLLVLLTLIAVAHTGIQFLISGTGIESVDQAALSGLAIGDVSIFEGIKQKYYAISDTSRYIIAAEWLVVLAIILIILIRGRIDLKKDTSHKNIKVKHKKPKPETDLDILYEMLKKKKSMRILTISKIFGVKKEVAMDWCNILESGDMAEIKYPIVGSPKLILPEILAKDDKKEVKKGEKEKAKEKGKKEQKEDKY